MIQHHQDIHAQVCNSQLNHPGEIERTRNVDFEFINGLRLNHRFRGKAVHVGSSCGGHSLRSGF